MSEARERYYAEELESWITISRDVAHDYVTELERQLSELKESQKQKQITRLCNRLDKAEQQNKQMIEALIMATKYMKTQRPFMDYSDDVELYENNIKIIESVTGEKIEEAVK